MSLTIVEKWESGAGALGRESEDMYIGIVSGDIVADNADDPLTVARFACQHFSLISAFGNILNRLDRERIAPGQWKFTATYKSPTYDRQTNDAAFSFSTGGGTQHVNCSRKTVAMYGATGTDGSGNPITYQPTDHKGAIGVAGDQIAGLDVELEVFDFKLTFYLPPSKLATNYVDQLYRLTKRVNSDSVSVVVDGVQCNFASGELRFISAEGSKRVHFGDWEITLNFSAIPNQTNLTVGPITGITKNGWDYLWVEYMASADMNSNTLATVPRAAYVEQVYDYQPLGPLILPGIFGSGNTQAWANPASGGSGGIS